MQQVLIGFYAKDVGISLHYNPVFTDFPNPATVTQYIHDAIARKAISREQKGPGIGPVNGFKGCQGGDLQGALYRIKEQMQKRKYRLPGWRPAGSTTSHHGMDAHKEHRLPGR